MYQMDVYKPGIGIIQKFEPKNSLGEVEDEIKSYLKTHNVVIIAREYVGDAHWNYLSDGTEIDYCECL